MIGFDFIFFKVNKSASITVFPVIVIFEPSIPSDKRLSLLFKVGAKCKFANLEVNCLFASSGKGT